MTAADFSKKSLARAVMDASRRLDRPVSTDHTRISDWLAGRQPRPDAVAALVLAFEQSAGRPYTAEELGLQDLTTAASDLGLNYEKHLERAVGVLGDLTAHDLSGYPGLRSARYSLNSLQALCLDWLLAQDVDELPSHDSPAVHPVHVEE